MNNLLFISIFLQIAGLIVGLGSVIVIDFHGFLARKSLYWTKATISTHKITKPLIWFGMFIYTFGLLLYSSIFSLSPTILLRLVLIFPMVLNGVFLSFYISPLLLSMEKSNSVKILQKKIQNKITVSLLFSDLAWWLSVFLLSFELVKYFNHTF